jgi:hypothetical protein
MARDKVSDHISVSQARKCLTGGAAVNSFFVHRLLDIWSARPMLLHPRGERLYCSMHPFLNDGRAIAHLG